MDLFTKEYLPTSVFGFLMIKKAECMAHTISDMWSVNGLQTLLFITTDLLQFYNFANITKQMSDQFSPMHIQNQR